MKLNMALSMVVVFVAGISAVAFSQTTASASPGKEIFARKCETCHGSDGAGTPVGKSLKVANLRSVLVQKKSDAELTHIISEGKNNMPPFGNALTPDELKALVSYVRTFKAKKK
jgi:mono/diheme cytochrome c family protein